MTTIYIGKFVNKAGNETFKVFMEKPDVRMVGAGIAEIRAVTVASTTLTAIHEQPYMTELWEAGRTVWVK